MNMTADDTQKQCPIDHKSRETWLKMSQQAQPGTSPAHEHSLQTPLPYSTSAQEQLGKERQISSIPRALRSDDQSAAASVAAKQSSSHSANGESSNAQTSASGHWLYPSEEMFFNAMKRKQYNPDRRDMPSIIPIHNAVNERTWHEILRWEKGQGAFEKCGGPKLISFSGDSRKLTPRARFFSLLGYQPPFDRHDWIVDRCGVKVDYVIDFYQGKGVAGKSPLNFYLDVRPKLNSLEGWRMRFMHFWGW